MEFLSYKEIKEKLENLGIPPTVLNTIVTNPKYLQRIRIQKVGLRKKKYNWSDIKKIIDEYYYNV